MLESYEFCRQLVCAAALDLLNRGQVLLVYTIAVCGVCYSWGTIWRVVHLGIREHKLNFSKTHGLCRMLIAMTISVSACTFSGSWEQVTCLWQFFSCNMRFHLFESCEFWSQSIPAPSLFQQILRFLSNIRAIWCTLGIHVSVLLPEVHLLIIDYNWDSPT